MRVIFGSGVPGACGNSAGAQSGSAPRPIRSYGRCRSSSCRCWTSADAASRLANRRDLEQDIEAITRHQTVAELVAKSKTERILYGSGGPGVPGHLATEMFLDAAHARQHERGLEAGREALTQLFELGDQVLHRSHSPPIMLTEPNVGTMSASW